MIDIGIAFEFENSKSFDKEYFQRQSRKAIQNILADAGVVQGEISVAVVEDDQMHELNRQFLNHDYTTDVLSFVLESTDDSLSGEVIVCIDEADRNASEFDWQTQSEILLYVIHGTLHLVGYRDKDQDAISEMRSAERKYLNLLAINEPKRNLEKDGTADLADAKSPPGLAEEN